jgi:hypothetical protein
MESKGSSKRGSAETKRSSQESMEKKDEEVMNVNDILDEMNLDSDIELKRTIFNDGKKLSS